MSFPPEFLNELRDRLPVSEIVGRRVRLQRKGREFQGLCPFHNEKTPSFTVNDDKGFYHCFGCGAHGDVITFVIETEALSFPETVEKLAQMAGLDVPREKPEDRERQQKRRTLEDVVEAACLWYERNLRLPVGKEAMEYLKGRGLDEATLKRFRLGYAPNERSALKAHLVAEGYEETLIVEAGLHKPAEDTPDGKRGPIDYFRNRVIFPITDRRGRVIGFGGRVMGDGQPKYLNSPDTPLFHKGRVLYGLAQARESAGKIGSVLVTEGYMDVIGLAMGGFDYAVAPLGTALTEDQIIQLWKLAPEPVLCFDGDSAGQRAAARAAERALPLLKPGFSLRFVTLPAKEDPDSLIRKEGPAAMRRLIDRAKPMVEALWDVEQAKLQNETPEQLALLRQTLEGFATRIEDRNIQALYRAALMRRMDETYLGMVAPPPAAASAAPAQSERRWKERPPRGRYRRNGFQERPITSSERLADMIETRKMGAFASGLRLRRNQQILLAAMVNHPALIEEYAEVVAQIRLDDPALDRLRGELMRMAATVSDLDVEALHSHFSAQGFLTTLQRLRAPEVEDTAPFVRAIVPDERTKLSLDDFLMRLSAQGELETQLAEAQAALADEMTEENWARMVSLRQALQDLVNGPSQNDVFSQDAESRDGALANDSNSQS
ncbi:MAG: DNA primase [Alphaproteobacteria bacterium]|nr:DNA primase [Alphaproteobacteria bacterium]